MVAASPVGCESSAARVGEHLDGVEERVKTGGPEGSVTLAASLWKMGGEKDDGSLLVVGEDVRPT